MRRLFTWVNACLALGLGLRLFHYLRGPSVWYDEAALLINVVKLTFLQQLGPLLENEAAPPLFLWAERAVSLVLGDGTYALRLFPFLGSCLALILFAWVVRRLLAPAAAAWAVLLMASSDRLLWHSCEAKPYAIDVLCAVGLLALYMRLRDGSLVKQCLIYAAVAPVVIFLSFPGCFLFGGLLVALIPALWRQRRPSATAGYTVLTLSVFASFLLLLGPIHAQRSRSMVECWVNQFPHWDRPWTVPGWMLFSTFDVVRYCFQPTGHALALLAGAGGVLLWRRGERSFVVLLALPLALALLASCLGAYPYGGARVEVYSLPALALLVAAAVPRTMEWLRKYGQWAPLGLTTLLAAPLVLASYHVVDPWPRADTAGAAAYVQTHRAADDIVAGNGWDFQYYFRDLRPAYQKMEELSAPPAQRVWLIVTGAPVEEEQAMIRSLATEWDARREQSFEQTTVYLLKRVAPAGEPSAPPRSRP
jgi:hypothetical protein